jgi:4-carboxymuconolactone decarboxylase
VTRFGPLEENQLSDQQRMLRDRILTGPRGKFGGPFAVWLHSPGALVGAEALGSYLRFDSALPKVLKEFSVLVVARYWRCAYEWEAHVRHSLAAGLSADTIAAIGRGDVPDGLDETHEVVRSLLLELLASGRVSDSIYKAAASLLTREQLVELTMLSGYYTMIAMTLNSFEIEADQPAAFPMTD